METISSLFKKTIPHYFENLPIPDTFGGWFKLGFKDWLSLVPLGAAIGGIGFLSYRAFYPRVGSSSLINPNLHKDVAKYVDVLDIEDLKDKNAFCRCWRSSKFPYCDGSHNKFNEITGDNVGPVVIERKKK
ncbi:UNVERIFIED_CONTAM: hypothetical protein PYX00_002366 [Menopon gallinae]|uniref:CDGSH iron-sulfur domain-containing protein 2 homologue n=1 Tax=Menopon gallinae TaxID=328185 RepID=A0AAW2IH06_9NEOP